MLKNIKAILFSLKLSLLLILWILPPGKVDEGGLYFFAAKDVSKKMRDYILKSDAIDRLRCRYHMNCRVFYLGQSKGGRAIYGYRIGFGKAEKHSQKRVDMISGMHGDEQTAIFVTSRIFNLLLDVYHEDTGKVFYIIPLSNPDAIYLNKRSIARDLNRVFLDDGKIDSLEEEAILRFFKIDQHIAFNSRLLLSIHSGAENVLYPPGDSPQIDNYKYIKYESLGVKYCQGIASYNKKCPLQSYFDYKTEGELADFYDKKYGLALTLEVSFNKHLSRLEKDQLNAKAKKIYDAVSSLDFLPPLSSSLE